MELDDVANLIGIANGTFAFLGYLPKAIETVRCFVAKNGFTIKTSEAEIGRLKGYLKYKKSKEEKRRCKAILKKHNLPKSVGIMCKSEKDICFIPNKRLVDKTMNNLNLTSSDELASLNIGGGFFALNIRNCESGKVHANPMYGTVIKYKGEIYLLRHPSGGFPHYLARLDLFIQGMIVELDDGSRIGLYY